MSYDHIIDAVRAHATGTLDYSTIAYLTDGGTYTLASSARINDDDQMHDLLAILPMPIEGTRVMPLRPTANLDLVATLRAALDPGAYLGAEEDEPEPEHRIVLDFEDADTLRLALQHLGESDAPVISSVQVITEGESHQVWDNYDSALAAIGDRTDDDLLD